MSRIAASIILAVTLIPAASQAKTVKAHVVALDQPLVFNRMGAMQAGGMIYALERDVVPIQAAPGATPCSELEKAGTPCQPGKVQLRGSKRPRPLVLRVDVGDDLEIHFRNLLAPAKVTTSWANTITRRASIHVMGLEWSKSSMDDGSYVGANPSSMPVPGDPEMVYTLHAATEGAYFMTSMAGPLGGTGAGQASAGLFGAVHVEPAGARWFRSQVTRSDLRQAADGRSPEDMPFLTDADYEKVYPSGSTWGWPDNIPIPPNTPILDMLNSDGEIVHSDLTAIIAGPNNFQFPGRPQNSTQPNRGQPFREFTIIYHDDFLATQAYLVQTNTAELNPGSDAFGINYGFGGIVAELEANRLGVGPEGGCVNCKFEEFFLSSWAVGDPAMLVDKPADGGNPANPNPPQAPRVPPGGNPGKTPFTQSILPQATVAGYPDDPSNVYHSYLSDHVTFRILSADSDLHHIHHQHAQQWLHTPNSTTSTYLDSQAIGPGSAFTLEMTYDGSGNRNKTIGDSIFHCHFYPHFAQGMWAMWRVHDVFEDGTETDPKTGKPVTGSRALPDAEIVAGTPIPAVVPMPTIVMAPKPSPVFIQNGQIVYGTPASPDPDGKSVTENPGYPFFIPGIAGQRAPGPPLDTAKNPGFDPAISDPKDPRSRPLLDGGLPRHVTQKGTWTQWETAYNWSKDVATMQAIELAEDGTHVEQVAMAFNQQKNHPSHTPGGNTGNFITNGLGPKQGAPYADPCGPNPLYPGPDPVRYYKAADIQLDVILNKKGWHFPQQRMLALWGDVVPTLFGNDQMSVPQKAPEPFFFRANSGECIEYWHTNLVPKYYELDNFQVRTPTDILGQHIHLVKFDVTSSDGAANGFNYEDGTLSPEEVQERVHAIDQTGGLQQPDGTKKMLTAVRPFYFCDNPSAAYFAEYCADGTGKWVGARTTIQRWWADPLTNSGSESTGKDRTMRTVFTHDHFGPSTHQQAGLYAALVIEPTGSTWFTPDPVDPTGEIPLGNRQLMAEGKTFPDGGPTSWQASIKTQPVDESYREFLLALQDMQLAYMPNSKTKPGGSPGGLLSNAKCSDPAPNTPCIYGWYSDPATAINIPPIPRNTPQLPQIVSEGFNVGTYSVNYRNEPTPFRAWDPVNNKLAPGNQGSLSFIYNSMARADQCLNVQPVAPATLNLFKGHPMTCKPADDDHANPFKYPAPLQPANNAGVFGGDPYTPLLRAYQNDKVQVRIIAGSHLVTHDFSMPGLKWFFEPSDHNSGYRNMQTVGISEHFEMLFTLPPTKGTADYQYLADASQFGIQNGIWGLLRAYDVKTDGKQPGLPVLPNNQNGASPLGQTGGCPSNASANVKTFTVWAISADQLKVAAGGPNKQMMNVRENVYNKSGLLYILKQENGVDVPDFNDILTGKRLSEPLVLRVNAGDCASVTLVNQFTMNQPVFQRQNGVPALQNFGFAPNFLSGPGVGEFYGIKLPASAEVGLSPQLLSFDVTSDLGSNLGKNPTQTTDATVGSSKTYNWYAGVLFDPETGQYSPQAVEFGATGLFSSDPIQQQFQGLEGALIVEPKGAIVEPDSNTRLSANIRPGPGATFQAFREFVVLTNDNNNQLVTVNNSTPVPFQGTSAANYGTEPWWLRMGLAAGQPPNTFKARQFNNIDLSCGLSDDMNGKIRNILGFTALQIPANPLVGDMGTAVYTAGAGSKVRFRVLNPGGVNDLVFELHGHSWQEEPYQNSSANIADNPVSQWQGSRMGHGARSHFDIVLDSAGGANAVPGDYLYRSHTANAFRSGMLGVFRVSEPGKDAIAISAQSPSNTIFYGVNSVNPDTGKFADSVDVFAPGTRSGNTCTGTKLGTIPLNHGDNPNSTNLGSSMNGMWWAKTTASTICAVSNFGGGQGGIGTLDVKTILSACTNIVPPATAAPANATPANVTTKVTTKAPATSQKHADDMIQRFERAVPPNPSDLPKSQRTAPPNAGDAQKK